MASDYDSIFDALREQGWIVSQTSNTHYRCAPPDKSKQLVHFSVSDDPRAVRNTITNLRRSGFVWPWSKPSPGSERQKTSHVVEKVLGDMMCTCCTVPKPLSAHALPHVPTAGERVETNIEILWSELKDAKAYHALAREHLDEARKAVDAAHRAHEASVAEEKNAAEALRAAKEKFDQAFAVA